MGQISGWRSIWQAIKRQGCLSCWMRRQWWTLERIQLLREGQVTQLPDLTFGEINTDQLDSNPGTLIQSGSINAVIENTGTAGLSTNTLILAYYDADENGIYSALDDEADRVIGAG